MKLHSPTSQRILIAPTYPNAGVRAAYQRSLARLVEAMIDDTDAQIKAAYLQRMTFDRSLVATLRALKRNWLGSFDSMRFNIAESFANNALRHHDLAFSAALSKGGFTVPFQLTPKIQAAMIGRTKTNVDLIRTIPKQFFKDIHKQVFESVRAGRKLGELTEHLHDAYGVTRRRAALIARDQNNKATAQIHKIRQLELGITTGIWRHTAASVHPREEHAAFDGEEYDIEKGHDFDDDFGSAQPGEAINCLPGDSPIELTTACHQLWRRWYDGELTELVTASGKLLKATPNHPVLTRLGWVSIQSVNVGDDVFSIEQKIIDGVKADVKHSVPTFADLFDTFERFFGSLNLSGSFEFHGDMANSEVKTIDIHRFLPSEFDAVESQEVCKFIFTNADEVLSAMRFPVDAHLQACCSWLMTASQSIIRGLASLLPLLKGFSGGNENACLRAIANMNTRLEQSWPNSAALNTILSSHLQLAHAGLIIGDDQFVRKIFAMAIHAFQRNAPGADVLRQCVARNAELQRYGLERRFPIYLTDSIVDKRRVQFSGHVYNLHNDGGWYSSHGALYHNCGCVGVSVIPGYDSKAIREGKEEPEQLPMEKAS